MWDFQEFGYDTDCTMFPEDKTRVGLAFYSSSLAKGIVEIYSYLYFPTRLVCLSGVAIPQKYSYFQSLFVHIHPSLYFQRYEFLLRVFIQCNIHRDLVVNSVL